MGGTCQFNVNVRGYYCEPTKGRPSAYRPAAVITPIVYTDNSTCATSKFVAVMSTTFYDQEITTSTIPCDQLSSDSYQYGFSFKKPNGPDKGTKIYCCINDAQRKIKRSRIFCQTGHTVKNNDGTYFTSEQMAKITCEPKSNCASPIFYGDNKTETYCPIDTYKSGQTFTDTKGGVCCSN